MRTKVTLIQLLNSSNKILRYYYVSSIPEKFNPTLHLRIND